MTEETRHDDYDSPWKLVLERFFPNFVSFFFPVVYEDIGWNRGYEFLDKELQEVTCDSELGRRLVDKLVKVWLKTGQEAWVLIHIEVQGQVDQEFPERMFVYHYRLYDRYHARIASLAVLADSSPGWRPDRFGYELWGCEVEIKFPIVKLLDYESRWAELEASENPFAVVVMAHLKTQTTQRDVEERSRWKLRLAKGLYVRGWAREDVLELLRFIQWLMRLPPEMEKSFREEIHRYEEERKMPYEWSFERLARDEGIEQGIQKGIQQSILDALESRFGETGLTAEERLSTIRDASRLRDLHRLVVRGASLEEFQRALAESST